MNPKITDKFNVVTYVPIDKTEIGYLRFIAISKGELNADGIPSVLFVAEGHAVEKRVEISELHPIPEKQLQYTFEKVLIDLPENRKINLDELLSTGLLPYTLTNGTIGHTYTLVNNGLYEINREEGGILGIRINSDGSITEIKQTPSIEPSIIRTYVPYPVNL